MDLTLLLGSRGILTNDWRVLPLSQVINEFIRAIPEAKKHTARAYRSDCNFLLAYLARAQKRRIDRLVLGDRTKQALQGFVSHRLQVGDAPATIARRLNCQRAFDSWFKDFVPLYPCPARDVKTPELEQLAFEGLTPTEASKLKEAAKRLPLLERLCIELLLGTGLRRQELLDLTEAQLVITPDRIWASNVRCKGDYFRPVYFPEDLRPLLCRWMNERDRILKAYRVRSTLPYPIIVSERGARPSDPHSFQMDGKTLWRIVRDAARDVSIQDCHPHKLRHTRAHEILETSKDLRLVQQGLGHKSLQTTVRYTERTSETLAEQLEKARRK